jgi:hypothetical protein
MDEKQRIQRGQRIKRAIEASTWNASTIAKMIGKSPSVMTQWITGATKQIAAANLHAFCRVTNGRPEWIESGTEPMRPTDSAPLSEDEAALLAAFRALPDGWQYYLRHKANELRRIAEALPRFVFDSFKPLPPEDRYWQWEQELNEYVRQQQPERNGQG